jgi:PAS domain S-box-containing protein
VEEEVRGAGPEEDRLVRELLEAAPTPVVAFGADQRILYVNSWLEELFGYSAEELAGAPYSVLAPERLREDLRARVDAWFADPEPRPIGSRPDFPGRRKDGSEFPMQYAITPVATRTGMRAIATLVDVTRTRQQEARLDSVRRSYLTLARLNETVVRAEDADSLLSSACSVAVEESGFPGAWVARPRSDGRLEVVARCGVLEDRPDACDADHPGSGPTATALGADCAVYARLDTDGEGAPWRTSARHLGVHALACLPLRCEGRAVAALTLYAAAPDAFDEPTRHLLEEMAANISFALEGFANTDQLHRVAVQRRDLLTRLVTAQEAERDRIAADLHRDAVPGLESADRGLERLAGRLSERAPHLVAGLEQVRDVLAGATESLRHLMFDLEIPRAGADLGAAIRESAAHVFFDPAVRWEVHADEVSLPAGQTGTALRIVKEALINVRKHARAAQVTVHARSLGAGVEVRVVDDGIGFDLHEVTPVAGHRGLVTMVERAEMAGGSLRAGRAEGGGAEVVLWLPQQAPEDDLTP